MGQQQLFLLILVTLIVGTATAVAINTFSEQFESSQLDSMRQDMAFIAYDAINYYNTPATMGGGGNSFSGINFTDISLGVDSLTTKGKYAYVNGVQYEFNRIQDDRVILQGTLPNQSVEGGLNYLRADITKDGITWNDNYMD